jgi:hypothetical protein
LWLNFISILIIVIIVTRPHQLDCYVSSLHLICCCNNPLDEVFGIDIVIGFDFTALETLSRVVSYKKTPVAVATAHKAN